MLARTASNTQVQPRPSQLELHAMFDKVDDSGVDDNKISFDEFAKMLPQLKAWGVVIDDPKAEFALIDVDGGGALEFEEFEAWALTKQLGVEAADD